MIEAIPADEVCKSHFSHLCTKTFKRYLVRGEIEGLSFFRIHESKKAPMLIKKEVLDAYLAKRAG